MVFQEEIWQGKYRFILVFQELFLVLIVQVKREWASFGSIAFHNLVFIEGLALPQQQAYKWQTCKPNEHTHRVLSPWHLSYTAEQFLVNSCCKTMSDNASADLDNFMPTSASEGKDTAFVPILWFSSGRLATRRLQYPTSKKCLFSNIFLLSLFSHLQRNFYWRQEGNTWLRWEENLEYFFALPSWQ